MHMQIKHINVKITMTTFSHVYSVKNTEVSWCWTDLLEPDSRQYTTYPTTGSDDDADVDGGRHDNVTEVDSRLSVVSWRGAEGPCLSLNWLTSAVGGSTHINVAWALDNVIVHERLVTVLELQQ